MSSQNKLIDKRLNLVTRFQVSVSIVKLWWTFFVHEGFGLDLFGLGFFVPLENFHSFGDVTIAGERLQIMTYARNSWPLCSDGS